MPYKTSYRLVENICIILAYSGKFPSLSAVYCTYDGIILLYFDLIICN